MPTLTPNMSILALLKAGCVITVQQGNKRFYRDGQYIAVQRFVPLSKKYDWVNAGEFPLTGAGLKEAIDYINLPF